MTTSGVTVTVINPLIKTISKATIVTNASILATNGKLDRTVHMVTSSQAATQRSIEEFRSEFKKDQEEHQSGPPKSLPFHGAEF